MDEILNEIPGEEPEIQEDAAALAQRQHHIRGALRYYSLLLCGVLALLILLLCLTIPVKTLLTQYETAQPAPVAQQIFDTLFTDPDWALVYDIAGIPATEFEGRKEYVAYMTAKTAGKPLQYAEIPAAPTGEKQYQVTMGDEILATFTMHSVDDGVSTFKRWTLGEVELFFTRQEAVTVTLMPEYTVYINGVALDDSYTTLQVSTVAEDYLPEGTHGYRYKQQTITGLLVRPSIVVLDEYNNAVPLSPDPETGGYTTPIATTVAMTEEESALVLATVQTQALFAIRAIPATDFRAYFTPGSQVYELISEAEPLAEGWTSYAFDESATVLTDFYRYSDTLFSVRAQMKLDVTGSDGAVTSFTIGGTYFFTADSTGIPVATALYDADLQVLRFDPAQR